MTGWASWSPKNCARNLNLAILTNGICTTHHLPRKIRHAWNFDVKTDHLISARRPDLIIINRKKKTCRIVVFTVPAACRVKVKESEKKDKYLDLGWELKKLWNMKVTIIAIIIGSLGTVTKVLIQEVEDLEIRGWVEIIIEIGQNIVKSPGDLRRFAVTQTSVK